MTELQLIVSGVTGAMTGGVVRPFLAPVDAVTEVWKEAIVARLQRTGERTARKRGEDSNVVSERTAVNALAAAALTDNDVVQEYLAGVVASASLENDNAHLLALVSRLTPIQLRMHYGLYLGAAMYCRRRFDVSSQGDPAWEQVNAESRDGRFVTLITDDGLPQGDPHWSRAEGAIDHLDRENLLARHATYWNETEQGVVEFGLTDFGIDLFAAALGTEVIAFGDFCEMDISRLQIEPPIPAMPTRSAEAFRAVYGPPDHDSAWRRMPDLP